MKKFINTLAALTLFLSTIAAASEQGVAISRRFNCSNDDVTCPASGSGTNLISGAALNDVAATLTIVFTLGNANNVAQYTKIKMVAQYTEVAATALTAVFYCSIDGTNYGQVNSLDIDAGAGTYSAYTLTAASATASPLIVWDVAGCAKAKVVYAATGAPGASDLLSVQAVAVVGD